MPAPDLVWYASYGSNMLWERFKVYLEGGTAPGARRGQHGARDSTHPQRSAWMDVPREVFFAGESSLWHDGGVAFLNTQEDPTQSNPVRMYLVTRGQFLDVFAQENGRSLGIDVDLDEITRDGSMEVLNSWYGLILCLDKDYDGYPVYTFTSANPPTRNPPHETYRAIIDRGLVERT